MATRNMLHVNKLKDFELFLVNKGYAIVETSKNPYEVLRAKKDKDTVILYKKADAKEHLSVAEKDVYLVNEFIYQKTDSEAQSNRVKLKEFLTLVDEDMLVDIVYHYMSECGFVAKELLIKRPELENTYVKTNGIEIHANELDYILAESSEERKTEFFKNNKQRIFEYLIVEAED